LEAVRKTGIDAAVVNLPRPYRNLTVPPEPGRDPWLDRWSAQVKAGPAKVHGAAVTDP
jgi:hypothetical protein